MLKQLWYYGAVPVKEVAMIVGVTLLVGGAFGFWVGR
jgi:hypothetical protein